MMGSTLQPDIRNEASGEILNQHLSSEKARSMLGWNARYTLEEGLTKTIEWYRSFLNA
jgi:CDP-glucose 4,6-dehydratase